MDTPEAHCHSPRRNFLKLATLGALNLGNNIALAAPASSSAHLQEKGMSAPNDGYTFKLSNAVNRTPVRYKNRYGIEIAADLYLPATLDRSAKHPAVVIGPPHSGVKEQGPGIYAQEMAKRGFIALAFDPAYNGESGGIPRHVSSPEIFAEDFSAGVDYLGMLSDVDRQRIGVIGMCGSGGFALSQAAVDLRIKAVATTAMYDISRMHASGWQDAMTEAERHKKLLGLAEQRWKDVATGQPALEPTFPKEIPSGLDAVTSEFFEYYVAERGRHLRSIGAFTLTSHMAHMNFGALRHVADIAPRAIMLITGEKAHSRYFSETVYAQASDPRELVVVPEARHIDLYDRVDMIPFEQLASFFNKYLT